ncbi:MerR family transcriptional regulator [Henriciella barbarensis]|uniref:MerR family transcriptional regulator n=1 Tax=Henriciella barbarensis TaxID=86342 RepID=A0A399R5T4_9PROT|nr:helix-turn-helix domain-containing protein [Henriciella barbarensis]RIJ26024.1 MerR family transcriptional regulator [Henriciella barbarensis]
MKALTIGRLSSLAGVKVTTIRYYETIGLMGQPDRSAGGQRQYNESAVQRLAFIRQARELGFPIEAIRELIELQTSPDQDCASVDEIARNQLADIRNRLRQLKALETELERMLHSCAGGQVGDCRVLAALGQVDQ